MGPESAQEGLPGGVRAPNVSKKSELQVLKNHRFPDAPFFSPPRQAIHALHAPREGDAPCFSVTLAWLKWDSCPDLLGTNRDASRLWWGYLVMHW
jgi:hypothetical protein